VFGKALIGLLDLALESFTRARVFEVFFNPCFLARMRLDRDQVSLWHDWVQRLSIFHSWDAEEKRERGYGDSPLHSWRQGLRRLLLGQVMDTSPSANGAVCFHDIIPYADLHTSDRDQVNAFVETVSRLLPRLRRLRRLRALGEDWAREIRNLADSFLDIPEDQPGEERVRDQLFVDLGRLSVLDRLFVEKTRKHSLGLIREYVHEHLQGIAASTGQLLTSGVTIASLASFRPVPFSLVYLIGMDESLFPGANYLPGLDLRGKQRQTGDVLPAEANRFQFLEAILAARQKLYITFRSRDPQIDQPFHVSCPVNQLTNYLEQHLLAEPFKTIDVPLLPTDARFLSDVQEPHCDVLVNLAEGERVQSLLEAERSGTVRLTPEQRAELSERLPSSLESEPALPAKAKATSGLVSGSVTTRELAGYLRCPAEEALKRYLHLTDDEMEEPPEDEPFFTSAADNYRVVRETLGDFIHLALKSTVDDALQDWLGRFQTRYEEYRLCGQMPESAYGVVDRDRLAGMLNQRIVEPGQLADFLRHRAQHEFCGSLLVGEARTPIGATLRFPSVQLAVPLGETVEVNLNGHTTWCWRSRELLEILLITNVRDLEGNKLTDRVFDPLLLGLLLKVGRDPALALPGAIGALPSSQQWLGHRGLVIHIAHEQGIEQFAYPVLPPAEAENYLVNLLRDFLDPNRYDLLPMPVIAEDDFLNQAFKLEDEHYLEETVRPNFLHKLEEAIEEDEESDFPKYYQPRFMKIVSAKIPSDAYERVRRWYRLPYSGVAHGRR
jgi:hypothetical protein